jgi:hypothetical protein
LQFDQSFTIHRLQQSLDSCLLSPILQLPADERLRLTAVLQRL